MYYCLLLFSTENIGRANTRAILRVFASRSPNNTQKNGAIVRNGEAHNLACYFDSYGVNKIRAAIPTKMATKRAGIMTTSMVPSWGDGGFDMALKPQGPSQGN
jgi:hypothetical protein